MRWKQKKRLKRNTSVTITRVSCLKVLEKRQPTEDYNKIVKSTCSLANSSPCPYFMSRTIIETLHEWILGWMRVDLHVDALFFTNQMTDSLSSNPIAGSPNRAQSTLGSKCHSRTEFSIDTRIGTGYPGPYTPVTSCTRRIYSYLLNGSVSNGQRESTVNSTVRPLVSYWIRECLAQ